MKVNVLDRGAVADGVTLCTESINRAIDEVSRSGGGYVMVPAGFYCSGTIHLKDNTYLVLEAGCTIYGSMNIADFKHASLRKQNLTAMILAENVEHSGILGDGTLDLRRNGLGYTKEHGRPCLVMPICCRDFVIQNVRLLNTGFFTIYSINNENVRFEGLTINSEHCENGDGIDFSGSRNVVISDCIIRTGDDAIGLKTHIPDEPCENITITNCILSSLWAGIRLGPETCGDMRFITVSNCIMNDCSDGIKMQECDRYRMEDITFSNITMNDVKRPLFITLNSYPMSGLSDSVRPHPGSMKRILFQNIVAHIIERKHNWFENQVVVSGIPDGLVGDIVFNNIYVLANGGCMVEDDSDTCLPEFIEYGDEYPDVLRGYPRYPSACMYLRNVDSIRLNDCVFETLEKDVRCAVAAENVHTLIMHDCEQKNCMALLRYHRVDMFIEHHNIGDIFFLSQAQVDKWEHFRMISMIEEDKLIHMAEAVDNCRKLEMRENISFVNEHLVFFTSNTGDWVLFPSAAGSIAVFANGELYWEWKRRAPYNHATIIAVKLPEYKAIITAIAEGGFRKRKYQIFK